MRSTTHSFLTAAFAKSKRVVTIVVGVAVVYVLTATALFAG